MKYSIIYADPPWYYHDFYSSNPTTKGSNGTTGYIGKDGKRHDARPIPYVQMKEEELIALPIKNLAEKNCTLFCWATSPKLPEAFRVIDAWGFTYKSMLTWDKVTHTIATYHNGNAEYLIIAGRGQCKPNRYTPTRCQHGLPSAIYSEKRTKHSVKPEWFVTDYIDKFWPNGNRIELFARRARPGWDVWGNEAPNSVEGIL